MFRARQVIGCVLQFSWIIFKGQGQPAPFYRELIQDYSYSNHPTTEMEIYFNMCFGTAPRAAAVKAIPVDETLPHRFNVSVLGLQRDRVMVQISRVDTPANWNWMELKIEWVVYFSDKTNSGWSVPVNGYVYKALFDQFPYEESSELCRNEGAWLAVYGPMRETTPVSEYWSLVPDLPNNAHFWIGLKIQGNNPSDFTYIWENWMPLSPGSKQWNENIGNHNSAKKCFAENHKNGDWSKFNCDSRRRALCERPA